MNSQYTTDTLLETERQSKLPLLYFTILISIMHICNVMAFKTITIFGHQLAFTGVFFPISFLILTVLTESYGHVETKRHIFYILIGQTILITAISIVVRIDIASGNSVSSSYYNLYKYLYRLIISSNLAVGLSYYFTSVLNSRFKCWLLGKIWWVRFIIANGIGKAILVISTYPMNFYKILSWDKILHLCINTWIFKMAIALVILSIAPLIIKINRRIDRVETYDFNVLYNPIRMYKKGNYGENYFNKPLGRKYKFSIKSFIDIFRI